MLRTSSIVSRVSDTPRYSLCKAAIRPRMRATRGCVEAAASAMNHFRQRSSGLAAMIDLKNTSTTGSLFHAEIVKAHVPDRVHNALLPYLTVSVKLKLHVRTASQLYSTTTES